MFVPYDDVREHYACILYTVTMSVNSPSREYLSWSESYLFVILINYFCAIKLKCWDIVHAQRINDKVLRKKRFGLTVNV